MATIKLPRDGFKKGDEFEIRVNLGFAYEYQTVEVLTGNVSDRSIDGLGEPIVPHLYVRGECGSKFWEPVARLYRRTWNGGTSDLHHIETDKKGAA